MTCPRCGNDAFDAQQGCRACGPQRAETISERAERRLVTVVFADISGFTALSERLDPEEVREITNECLSELVSVVHRYGGTVDKFIGDAVMAIFGAPHAHEDDAERAVAVALEMRQGLAAASERLAARLPQPLALHVGINTGLVVAGRVGSAARSDYTVLGDAVNLAARLEDLSEGGQILVSEATYAATQHAFAYKELPPATVKGKRQPIAVYELLGVRARRSSQRGLPGVETPFVGRATEMATLATLLVELSRGHGALVTLSGPAGVGKSRLLRELRTRAEEQGAAWVQAGTSSLGQGGALAIWGDAIRRLLALRSGGKAKTTTLQRGGADVLPPRARAGTSAALAELLGMTLPMPERTRLAQLDETALRGQLFLAVRDLLQGLLRSHTLVLVLEDLHWADEASFDLLRFVAELTSRLPLLVVGTYRSDATTIADALPGPEALPRGTRRHIELAPLSEHECRSLAVAVLGTDERLAPVRDLLVAQAEGNPLYLEEILRALAQQGAITATGHGWRLTAETVEAVLPASLQGLLLDRIDRLPEQRKRLLQIAAVAGRQFPPELVWQIAGEGAAAAGHLDDLVREGFLERAESINGLRFRHALMQEAAYSSLLLRHRRSYHRRVAETLEARPVLWAVRAELPAVLTHHWERAEEWGRAAAWAMRAAEQARRAFAPAEATRLYERALTAARNSSDTAVTRLALSGLAEASLVAGDADRALETLEQALALGPEPLERAVLERRQGQAFARLGMQASAGDAFARAAACLGEEQPDESDAVRAERSTLRIQAAFSHLARGAVLLARAAAEEVLRLQVGGGDEADALRLLGAIDRLTGDPAAAAERLIGALTIAEGIGDLPRQAVLHEQIGLARLAARDRGAGAAALRAALDLYRRLGDHCGVGRCLYELGVDALHAGALADAITLLREAIKEADSGDDPALRGRAGLQLGRAFALTGDWAAAVAAFERAGADDEEAAGEAALERLLLDVSRGRTPEADLRATLAAADGAGQHHAAARARIGLATLARRTGHTDEARAHLRAALEQLADPTAETALLARAALAQVAAGEGNARAALKVAAQARALAEEHGPATAVWFTRRVYGAALEAAGAHEAGEQELRGVVEAARRAGARPELAAALSAWARARRSLGDPTGAADALAELRDIAASLGTASATGAVR